MYDGARVDALDGTIVVDLDRVRRLGAPQVSNMFGARFAARAIFVATRAATVRGRLDTFAPRVRTIQRRGASHPARGGRDRRVKAGSGPSGTLDNMTRSQQQAQERRHLEMMIAALGLQTRSEPSALDPPLPDFALELADGRRIGIELTQSRGTELARAFEGTRDQLQTGILDVLRQHSANALVDAYALIEDLVELQDTPGAVAAAIERVAKIAMDSLPSGKPPTRASKLGGVNFLQHLSVRPAATPSVLLATSALPLGAPYIQLAIDAKRRRLAGYQQLGADEYWLLVVGGATISGYITVGDTIGREFDSPFDRTIFLDESDSTCVFLETTDHGRDRG